MIQKNMTVDERGDTVNLRTMKKILQVLSEYGRVKRTQLSVRTGMPYDRCMRYVNILKLLKLANVSLDEKSIFVTITQTGNEFVDLLDYT